MEGAAAVEGELRRLRVALDEVQAMADAWDRPVLHERIRDVQWHLERLERYLKCRA